MQIEKKIKKQVNISPPGDPKLKISKLPRKTLKDFVRRAQNNRLHVEIDWANGFISVKDQ